jgi:hypothetical protein
MITAPSLAAAVGEACVALGIRQEPGAVAEQVLRSIREPIDQFHRYVNWPCALNDSGLPVELSLKLDTPGSPALRCVVDVTDHHFGPAGNWQRYLDQSIAITGCRTMAQADAVWALCRTHLDGVPPRFPSRLVHGLGYGGPDRVRGSLYFRTGWLAPERLAGRLPEQLALASELRSRYACPVPERIEVMGYDFTAGELQRSKLYTWLPVHPEVSFSTVAGTNPDLAAAGQLFTRHAHAVPPPARGHAVFLQWSRGADFRQRLFFFAAPWGWTTPEGLKGLLGMLDAYHGVDLEPLVRFREVLTRHEVRMRLSMVAVGGSPERASVTFYFLPTASPTQRRSGGRPAGDNADIRGPYNVGVAYLLAQRQPGGEWVDFEGVPPPGNGWPRVPAAAGPADEFVTAYVAATLARDPALHAELGPTADWLASRYRPGLGWGWNRSSAPDSESAALALLALARLGRPLPEGWEAVLARLRTRDAEVTATLLLLLAERVVGTEGSTAVGSVAARLLRLQRQDGGWTGRRWTNDLVATGRAVCALGAVEASALAGEQPYAVRRALGLGLGYVGATLIARDSFQLGLWLRAWLACGGSVRNATVGRIAEALARQQRPDGRWPGVPTLRHPVDDECGALVDANSVITTVTAAGALHALVAAGGLAGNG